MTDTPDPISEVVQEPAIPHPEPVKRSSPVLPILGGAVAALIGFGVAQVVPNGWPIRDTTALETSLAEQALEVAALRQAVAEPAAPDPDMAARLQAIEEKLALIDLAPLASRIDAVERTTADLAQRPQTGGTADPAALAALQAKVDALQAEGIPAAVLSQATAAVDAKLAEADAKIEAIKQEAEGIAKSAGRRAALGQILAALDSGAPYVSALPNLGETEVPAAILAYAETGLPSLQSLRDSFPDYARLALEAALSANTGQSWTERFTTFVRGQTGARSLELREGTDPDALLSQAEAALAAGDLATALTKLEQLPPEAQAAMAEWRERAMARQTAAAAVQALLAASEM
jgi:hypothetical protein